MTTNRILNLLGKDDRSFLESRSMRHAVEAGHVLFREGDACANFVLVLNGSIRVQKVSETGRQIVLYHVGDSDICALTTTGLIGHSVYQAEGVADTPVEMLLLPDKAFTEMLDRSPAFRESVFASLASRITSLIVKIDEVTFTKMAVRLARALVEAEKRQGTRVLEMSHQDLADELGTAREVVSRQLSEFQRRGWIRLDRRSLEVLVPDLVTVVDQEKA
ncbi:MAG: Crp/Fnr family transcriptional regulator [Bdellovibrionaceae bacterium]|nr:Crp/Fnr family transcriptional regulator [Pseudobdellovibrionaceae bacterium]